MILPIAVLCNTDKDSSQYYHTKAKEFAGLRKTADADKSFNKALSFDPDNLQLRQDYAQFCYKEHRYHLAIQQYKKLFEAEPVNQSALLWLTHLSFLVYKFSDVVEYGTKLNPEERDTLINYFIGKAYYEEEDFGEAKKYLMTAVKANPYMSRSLIALGKVLIELGDYREAIVVYNQAIDLSPDDSMLIYELGLLHFATNEEKEAVSYFEKAAAKGLKTDLDYLENLGMAYLAFDVTKGKEILEKVLEKKPDNASILMQIAQAQYKMKHYNHAADTYYRVYLTDPNETKALYMSGMAYYKSGNKEQGNLYCEKAIKIDPSLSALKKLHYGN